MIMFWDFKVLPIRACLYGAELLGKPSYSPGRSIVPACSISWMVFPAVVYMANRVTRLGEIHLGKFDRDLGKASYSAMPSYDM